MKSLFLLWLLLIPHLSFAGVFEYRISGYPKEERNCHQQTPLIATLFENGTHAKVLHVECKKESQTGFDFSIEYEAPEKLEFTSTDYSFNLVANSGRYRQLADCQQNLPEQTELFKNTTGLMPFLTYCRSLELEVGKNWEVIITALGTTSKIPRIGSYLFFHEPKNISLSDLKDGLKKALLLRGAVLADLVLHFNSVMGTGSGSIHYFGPESVEFSMERLSSVPSLAQCEAQLREAKSFLDKVNGSLFTLYCAGSSYQYVDLHFGIAGKSAFTWHQSVDQFNTFQECESNRSQVLAHYSGSAIHPLLGGLCSRDYRDSKYYVILFKG